TWIYTLALMLLAVWAARGARTRAGQILTWLGFLNLAALRSALAPAFYVLAPVLWLLAILASQVNGRKWAAFAVVIGWALVMGPPPLPDRADLLVGLVCQAVAIGVSVAAVCWPVERKGSPEPRAWADQAVPDPA